MRRIATYLQGPSGIVIGYFFLLVLIAQLLGFKGLAGQDPFEYLRYARELNDWVSNGINPEAFAWPVLYPILGAMLGRIVGSEMLALQLISMAASAGSLYLLLRISKMIWPDELQGRSRWLLGLTFALSPYFFRASLMIMADVSGAFFVLLGLFCLLKFQRTIRLKWLIGVGLMAGAAVMTRYAAVAVMVPLSLLAAWSAVKNKKIWWLIFPAIAGILMMSLHILLKEGDPAAFIRSNQGFHKWSLLNLFRREFAGSEGTFTFTLPNILYMLANFFHPGYLLGGVLLLVFEGRKFRINAERGMILGLMLIYALFLGGFPFQNLRFLLLTFPLALLFLFPGMQALEKKVSDKKWLFPALLIVFALGSIGLTVRAILPGYSRAKIERSIHEELEKKPSNTVYSFDIDVALKGYGSRHKWVNLYENEPTEAKAGEWVLFNEPQLAPQWEGHAPFENYRSLQTRFRMKTVDSLAGGWVLYELR